MTIVPRKLRPVAAGHLAASLALGLGWAVPARASTDAANDADPQRSIIVLGQRVVVESIDRIATDPVDTPQSVSAISREELERRGIANLNDALRGVAGLSLGAGETSFQGNNAILRGFTTRNDLFLDNARDYGYYYRDTFDDERIEVLKGPSSILFGRGSTGGVIHRSSKRPTSENFITGDGQIGLDDLRRIAIDANAGQVFGRAIDVRLNAVAHHNAVADRDAGFSARWGVAPAIAIGKEGATRLAISYLHQEERNRPDYGVPWIAGTAASPGVPAPVPRSNYYGFSNDYLNTNVNILTGRLTHPLSDDVLWRTQLRYSSDTRGFRYSEAVLPAGTTRSTPLDTVRVGRNLFEGASVDRFFQGQSEVEAVVALGPTRHTLIAGIEAGSESSDPLYINNVNVPGTSLITPTGGDYVAGANSFVRLTGRSRSRFIGLFAIDTVEIGPRWRAVLGVRWDSFQTRYSSQRFAQSGAIDRDSAIDRTDRKVSYRAAVIYKPAASGSIYGSYATSFNPSGEGVESLISAGRSVAQSNLDLAPETSWSAEVGSKWEIFGKRALFTVALFRIEKDNVRVPDPATPGFNILGGRQRVDGFEVELSGAPLPGWHVRANYSLLDSKTVKSSPAGPIVGAPLVLTPRHSGSISTAYDITPRLEAGINLIVSSSRLGQNTSALYLRAPGYAVVDLSASYRVTRQVTVRLLVNNIGDKLYYDQLHPFHVIPGAGRTGALSVNLAY